MSIVSSSLTRSSVVFDLIPKSVPNRHIKWAEQLEQVYFLPDIPTVESPVVDPLPKSSLSYKKQSEIMKEKTEHTLCRSKITPREIHDEELEDEWDDLCDDYDTCCYWENVKDLRLERATRKPGWDPNEWQKRECDRTCAEQKVVNLMHAMGAGNKWGF